MFCWNLGGVRRWQSHRKIAVTWHKRRFGAQWNQFAVKRSLIIKKRFFSFFMYILNFLQKDGICSSWKEFIKVSKQIWITDERFDWVFFWVSICLRICNALHVRNHLKGNYVLQSPCRLARFATVCIVFSWGASNSL